MATTTSEILLTDTDKAINMLVEWSEEHRVSPCDFLFFALKRLITREAPELEESVQSVFKIFLKKAELGEPMTAIEGLALKINADLSNSQYLKLRQNKKCGSELPSLQRVIKEKFQLDPGNVNYKIFKTNGEVEVHGALADSGIIDIDTDLGNFSYGDLNINVHGFRSTLHDTIAKLYEEKYPDILEEIERSPDSSAILSDPERKMKLFIKVGFDGTSASVRSSKGDNRIPVSNWFRGTVGLVGLEILYHKGDRQAVGDDLVADEDDPGNAEQAEVPLGDEPVAEEQLGAEDPRGVDANIDLLNMNAATLVELLPTLSDQIATMSLTDIVRKMKK